MKNLIVAVVLGVCLLSPCCCARPNHSGSRHIARKPLTMGQLQHKLVSLKTLLDQHKILRAEVRYFPYYIETYGTPVIENPDNTDISLEGSDCYQLYLIPGSQKLKRLTAGLSQVKVSQFTEHSIDCRWGVIFRIDGGADLAIFIDRRGQYAIINHQAVNIDSRLLKLLEATFMDAFQ